MKLEYNEEAHQYTVDGVPVPSLTQMLSADGLSSHLDVIHPLVVKRKAEWGSALHLALAKAEYDLGIDMDFQVHCHEWLDTCRRMQWMNPFPIWKNCELPVLGIVHGLYFGFTPDRASPDAVVEIKGTSSEAPSHHIQTAIQVLGMGYDVSTPRYIAYFSKDGMRCLRKCVDTVYRDGRTVSVWDESYRIIDSYAELIL